MLDFFKTLFEDSKESAIDKVTQKAKSARFSLKNWITETFGTFAGSIYDFFAGEKKDDMPTVSPVTQRIDKPRIVSETRLSQITDEKQAYDLQSELPTREKIQDVMKFFCQRHNVPYEMIKAQFQQESAGNSHAESRVGASGLGQIMPNTAVFIAAAMQKEGHSQIQNMLGDWKKTLKHNWVQNLDMGVWYMKFLKNELFGSKVGYYGLSQVTDEAEKWKFTLAAYNSGQGTVRRIIQRHVGEVKAWSDVKDSASLPGETRHYVAVISQRSQLDSLFS